MKSEIPDKIVFLVIIAGRKQKENILTALSEEGVRLTNTIYGKGTVKASYLENLIGLVPEEHKTVITCVLSMEKANTILKMLVEKFDFDRPNTGIALTIPIDRLSF